MNHKAPLKYADKVVVITGARKGLGRSLVLYFQNQGAKVVGLSRGEANFEGAGYSHFTCDVGDAKQVQETFTKIGQSLGRIDVLVNNAGVLTAQFAMILSAANAEEMVRTNLLGTFFASREAAKIMKRTGWGRIINISSMAASLEPMGDSIYASCKAAVSTLANVMAKEFSSFHITCNTLGVTAIPTDMLSKLPKDKIDAVVQALPIPRYATEDDIFNVIDFFASDRSSYITAQTVYLGGLH